MVPTHSRGNMDGVGVLALFIHHPVEVGSQISSRVVLEEDVQGDGRIFVRIPIRSKVGQNNLRSLTLRSAFRSAPPLADSLTAD